MNKLKCILLVDDDTIANFLNKTIIEEMKITECIDIVTNGLEALQYLKNKPAPALILLDLRMPVLDGFEFLEFYNSLLIKGKESIKIVVLSSSSLRGDVEHAIHLGATDYLVKPVSEAKVREIIDSYFTQ